MKNGMLIAAPMSGSGKTTVARGLMSLLRRRGYRVQPMKCGPDYIDTKFHEAVCGRPSVNLDLFMSSPAHVSAIAEHYAATADICLIEGMMGLYDGYDRDCGSCYEIARLLDVPVLLVVDARSAAYSMAALLKGFVSFRPDFRLLGVVLNKVGSPRHAQMLREVCADVGVPCLGCLPRNAAIGTQERYLGLDFSDGTMSGFVQLDTIADFMEQHLDLSFLELLLKGRSENVANAGEMPYCNRKTGYGRVAVARSPEAFSFIYQSTLDCLSDSEVVFFNPEADEPLPEGTDLLYLPGGYPEKHVEQLVKARRTRGSIHEYAAHGGKVIAECGGMMYLCSRILTDEGEWEMCGVLPYTVSARQADRHLSLGYRRWEMGGREYRGHEFHYSQFIGDKPSTAVTVWNARGEEVDCPIIRIGNVLASYTHWYWGETGMFEF